MASIADIISRIPDRRTRIWVEWLLTHGITEEMLDPGLAERIDILEGTDDDEDDQPATVPRIRRKGDGTTNYGLEFVIDRSNATYGKACFVSSADTTKQLVSVGLDDPTDAAPGGTIDAPYGNLNLDGDQVVVTPNIAWKSGTSFKGVFDHANTADRTYTYPDASFTVTGTTGGTTNRVPKFDASDLLVDSTVTDDGSKVSSTVTFSSPGAGANSERYGDSATAGGDNATAVGKSAAAGGDNSVAVGTSATVGVGDVQSTAVGSSAESSNTGGTAVGFDALASGLYSTALGNTAVASGSGSLAAGVVSTASGTYSIAIGYNATNTESNSMVVGGSGTAINTTYIGNGRTHATPSGTSVQATGGVGSNISGAALSVSGGRNTGSGTAGSVKFQTSDAGGAATTLGTLVDRAEISRTDFTTTLPFTGDQNIAFKSGTSFKGTFDHANAADRTYTFPDADITVENTGHAAKHQNGGADEVATATPAANAIPKAGAGGTLDAGWIPSTFATDAEVTTAIANHAAEADPHTGYQKESEKDAANGYAGLDANARILSTRLQIAASDRIVGRDTAAAGASEELTVGGGIEFTGTGGLQRSALTGDVTATAGSGTTAIAAGAIVDADVNAAAAIALSKLANVSATDKVLGRSTAGAGAIEEIACTAAGRALLDDADAAAQRTTLGVSVTTGTIAKGTAGGLGDSVLTESGATVTLAGTLTVDAKIGWKDSTTFKGILAHANTASDKTYTFPDATGTVPLLSSTNAWTGSNDFNGGTLLVKRGTEASLPEILSSGEFYVATDTSRLFVGV